MDLQTQIALQELFIFFMLMDIPKENISTGLNIPWVQPQDCHFPLFNQLVLPSLLDIGLLYNMKMWMGVLDIHLVEINVKVTQHVY